MKTTTWTNNELWLLKNNYGIYTIKGIQKNFLPNRTEKSIGIKASRLGLKSNLSCIGKPKYTYNKYFFTTPNLNNSYIAGLIAADGNIHYRKNSYVFSIGFKERDFDLLENVKNIVEYDGPTQFTTKTLNGKVFHGYRFTINNIKDDWLIDLNKHWNITEHKSLTLMPPNVTDLDLSLAFIAGYLDGDGSINISKRDIFQLSFLGTLPMLDWITKTLYNIEDNKEYVLPKISQIKNNKAYRLHYSYNRALKIAKLLHGIQTPFKLNRKWDKIKEYESIKYEQ